MVCASAARAAAAVAALLRSSEKTPPVYGTTQTCSIWVVYRSCQVDGLQGPVVTLNPAMVTCPAYIAPRSIGAWPLTLIAYTSADGSCGLSPDQLVPG